MPGNSFPETVTRTKRSLPSLTDYLSLRSWLSEAATATARGQHPSLFAPITRKLSSVKRAVRNALDALLRTRGLAIVATRYLHEWQLAPVLQPIHRVSQLPADARAYLRSDNPVLVDLQNRYERLDSAVTTPAIWSAGFLKPEDLLYFRGDNPYVWQLRGQNMNPPGYALAYYHARAVDTLDLLGKLEEDELFGIFTFEVDGRRVSRDLLDSVAEINFLERHLQLSARLKFRVLDIGAGYGRLAHRMVEGLPNLREYLCTDAVAASTFVCEYYLQTRGVAPRALVVPVDQLSDTLGLRPVDLAVNIHSFSECSLPAISWWMELVSRARVKYLMIVPNSLNNGGTRLLTNELQDFQPVVARHGYRLVAKDPKYCDPLVQQYAICPTYYYLFELVPGGPES
jgi:hypothetical protein